MWRGWCIQLQSTVKNREAKTLSDQKLSQQFNFDQWPRPWWEKKSSKVDKQAPFRDTTKKAWHDVPLSFYVEKRGTSWGRVERHKAFHENSLYKSFQWLEKVLRLNERLKVTVGWGGDVWSVSCLSVWSSQGKNGKTTQTAANDIFFKIHNRCRLDGWMRGKLKLNQ